MSDYTKIVDFAAKDALITGNPAKLVKGTEIGAELDAISTAIATKHDAADIGVIIQAYDADLTTWAGVTPGTGVATALAVNVGTAGAPVVNGGVLGTPSSGTVTNLTGTASININGTVGATTPAAATVTSLTDSGNIAFTGTGNRITGDFSNATVANRVLFQTSTVNGYSVIDVKPDGTGSIAGFEAIGTGHADPANASSMFIGISGPNVSLQANKTGTGAYGYMTFNTGGSERMRIDTSGVLSMGATTAQKMNWFLSGNTKYGVSVISGALAHYTPTGGNRHAWGVMSTADGSTFAEVANLGNDGTFQIISGTGSIGYGTGAGGTVTQATSKATAVTLNKPTGQITMNNASLAAGATVSFAFNNSILAATDTMIVNYVLGSGTDSAYRVRAGVLGGIASVFVENVSGAPLSEAIKINFAIIKGATS